MPDGDSRLSIVRNFKFINTLKPNANGYLDMYISVCPNGVIHQLGGLQASTVLYKENVTATGGFDAITVNTSNRLILNPLLPRTATPKDSIRNTAYRVVNAVHKFEFTGPTLYNGGLVTVNPVTTTTSPATLPAPGTDRELQRVEPIAIPVNNASTLSTAAKNPFTIVQLPRDTGYEHDDAATIGRFYSSEYTIPFVPTEGIADTYYGGYAPHPSLRVYRVRYEGLNAEASISITSDVCVQYLVDIAAAPGEATFAKPSEFTDSNMLMNFLGAVGSSPMVQLGINAAKRIITEAVRHRAPVLLPLMNGV